MNYKGAACKSHISCQLAIVEVTVAGALTDENNWWKKWLLPTLCGDKSYIIVWGQKLHVVLGFSSSLKRRE
jgi:hypothetical protein